MKEEMEKKNGTEWHCRWWRIHPVNKPGKHGVFLLALPCPWQISASTH